MAGTGLHWSQEPGPQSGSPTWDIEVQSLEPSAALLHDVPKWEAGLEGKPGLRPKDLGKGCGCAQHHLNHCTKCPLLDTASRSLKQMSVSKLQKGFCKIKSFSSKRAVSFVGWVSTETLKGDSSIDVELVKNVYFWVTCMKDGKEMSLLRLAVPQHQPWISFFSKLINILLSYVIHFHFLLGS